MYFFNHFLSNLQGFTKIKKLRLYRFIALKSSTLNKIYDKNTHRTEIRELSKSLNGQIKGFDDRNLAEHWLRQGKAGRDRRK